MTTYPKITPLGNHVLIRRDDPTRQIGLIIVPDSAQQKAGRGTIVAVGRGNRTDKGTFIPCDCAPGDIVLFPPQLGAEVTVDGQKFTLLADDAVIGIIGREEAPRALVYSVEGEPDATEEAP